MQKFSILVAVLLGLTLGLALSHTNFRGEAAIAQDATEPEIPEELLELLRAPVERRSGSSVVRGRVLDQQTGEGIEGVEVVVWVSDVHGDTPNRRMIFEESPNRPPSLIQGAIRGVQQARDLLAHSRVVWTDAEGGFVVNELPDDGYILVRGIKENWTFREESIVLHDYADMLDGEHRIAVRGHFDWRHKVRVLMPDGSLAPEHTSDFKWWYWLSDLDEYRDATPETLPHWSTEWRGSFQFMPEFTSYQYDLPPLPASDLNWEIEMFARCIMPEIGSYRSKIVKIPLSDVQTLPEIVVQLEEEQTYGLILNAGDDYHSQFVSYDVWHAPIDIDIYSGTHQPVAQDQTHQSSYIYINLPSEGRYLVRAYPDDLEELAVSQYFEVAKGVTRVNMQLPRNPALLDLRVRAKGPKGQLLDQLEYRIGWEIDGKIDWEYQGLARYMQRKELHDGSASLRYNDWILEDDWETLRGVLKVSHSDLGGLTAYFEFGTEETLELQFMEPARILLVPGERQALPEHLEVEFRDADSRLPDVYGEFDPVDTAKMLAIGGALVSRPIQIKEEKDTIVMLTLRANLVDGKATWTKFTVDLPPIKLSAGLNKITIGELGLANVTFTIPSHDSIAWFELVRVKGDDGDAVRMDREHINIGFENTNRVTLAGLPKGKYRLTPTWPFEATGVQEIEVTGDGEFPLKLVRGPAPNVPEGEKEPEEPGDGK